MVSEIYSPPRVTAMLRTTSSLPSQRLVPGFALDLTCTDPDDGLPWDFDDAAKREKARQLIRDVRPMVLIGSPMCTAWCTWQRLNNPRRDPEAVRRELTRARLHLDFVISLYRDQLDAVRLFLHEHPQAATSWEEEAVKELLAHPDVSRVTADQCQYGAEVQFGEFHGQPVRKATGFMSNGKLILEELRKDAPENRGGVRERMAVSTSRAVERS